MKPCFNIQSLMLDSLKPKEKDTLVFCGDILTTFHDYVEGFHKLVANWQTPGEYFQILNVQLLTSAKWSEQATYTETFRIQWLLGGFVLGA